MMKALYSGVSGMRSHQTKMDVIGNNIANVNTYGFKTQRATFRDIYYQTIKNPGEATAGTVGGTNSSQVGYGAQVGSVDTIHTISGYSPTNKSTDLYINGEGYLAVKNSSDETFFTRLGALSFDSKGNLVDVNGSRVLGWDNSTGDNTYTTALDPSTATNMGVITIENFDSYGNITINKDGTITATKLKATTDINSAAALDSIVTIGFIPVVNIPNQNALVLEGNSYYRAGNNSGIPIYNKPGKGGTGEIITGGLEMSNVDLANEFSDMIITQRGYQANTKIITVVDQMLEELVNLKR
jgi:flagellar hook protein FlgE